MTERQSDTAERVVIVGATAFAEIAYEYFTHDSPYEVVGFAVERAYLKASTLMGLPVVPFETVEHQFPPNGHKFFAACTYTESNRLRARLYRAAKAKGFAPASYVSSRAFVWRNCRIGEHCFIFEGNVVQPFVTLGDNVVLWSGNHIGHHSSVKSHTFVASHVVVGGFGQVGEFCFLGVNATVSNNVRIGNHCTLGAGALVLADVEDHQTVVGTWGGRR